MSTVVQFKTFLFFTKARLIILTDQRIIVANAKTKHVRFMNKLSELTAVTKSLRIAANNFIVHFGQRSDEEWFCERRDEFIELMQEQYQ